MFCLLCVFVLSVLCLSRISSYFFSISLLLSPCSSWSSSFLLSLSLLLFSPSAICFFFVSFLGLFQFLPSFVSASRLRFPSSCRFISFFLLLARSLFLCFSRSPYFSRYLFPLSVASDFPALFCFLPRFGFLCWRLGCGGGGWGSLQYRRWRPLSRAVASGRHLRRSGGGGRRALSLA